MLAGAAGGELLMEKLEAAWQGAEMRAAPDERTELLSECCGQALLLPHPEWD